jgi:hypothetical protein
MMMQKKENNAMLQTSPNAVLAEYAMGTLS